MNKVCFVRRNRISPYLGIHLFYWCLSVGKIQESNCIIFQRSIRFLPKSSINNHKQANWPSQTCYFFSKKLFYPLLITNGTCLNWSVKRKHPQTAAGPPWPWPRSCLRTPTTRLFTFTRLEWDNLRSASSLVRRVLEQFLEIAINKSRMGDDLPQTGDPWKISLGGVQLIELTDWWFEKCGKTAQSFMGGTGQGPEESWECRARRVHRTRTALCLPETIWRIHEKFWENSHVVLKIAFGSFIVCCAFVWVLFICSGSLLFCVLCFFRLHS